MIENLITSVLAFASTNMDDLFILLLFFSGRNVIRFKIITGQYLGIATLVLLSLVGSYIGNFVDQRYVGILGLFPIYLAIRQLVNNFRQKSDDNEAPSTQSSASILAVAGVTIANGADNIGVYVPLMTTMSSFQKIQMIIVFAVMTYLWCLLAIFLASRPLIARQLDRFGHIITPIILFCLGVFILIESGTVSLIF